MPIATPQGTLDFKSVDKVTFVGASSNTVIDTTTGSLGVGVGVDGPTSNLHVVGNTRLEGNAYVSSNLQVGTANLFVDTVTGRVGIGTATPSSNLHVTGNAYVSSNLQVGTANNLFVDSVGNKVGIGTNNPLSTLEVGNGTTPSTGDASGSITVFGTGATKSNGARPGIYHRANVGLGLWSDASMSFEVNGSTGSPTEAMRISTSGSVGIGTSSPGAKLHIGAFDNNHLLLTSANNDYGWKIDTDDQGNGEVPFRIYRRTGTADTLALSIANQDGKINHTHTEKFNFHWNPNVWSWGTNVYAQDLNLWDFTLNVPYDGWIFIKCHAHWARYNSSNNAHAGGNESFYAWLSVASRSPDLAANYDSHTGSSDTAYDRFHSYQSPDSSGAGSWRDFNHSGFYKVSAGNNTVSLRVTNYFGGGHYLNINGGGVSGFYMPRNYI